MTPPSPPEVPDSFLDTEPERQWEPDLGWEEDEFDPRDFLPGDL